MKEIEQIVTDYLFTEHTDFAIMINGDWGCGKTYYIKKTLFEKIKSIDSYTKVKKNVTLKYNPLYVSLYGVSDVNDVLYKIQLELNPWLKSKSWAIARTGINKFASFFNVGASKEDEKNILSIFNIEKNRVLFFDDLERIDKSISLSSILGQINHFTEQDNLKVVIVCNSSKAEDIFNEINEKTIRFSCEYNPQLEDLYENLISEYKSPYNDFLKENKETVISVFGIAKYKNLRTLRFILDVFQKIYNEIKGKEYDEDLLARFFFFITIYSVEYKNGNKREKLDTLVNVGPYSKIFNFEIENLMIAEKGEIKTDETNYSQLFKEKYTKIVDSFNYSEEIANYVQNGYLDKEKLNQEITEIQIEIKKEKGTDEEVLLKKIKNWRELSDNEFNPLLEKILTKVDEGKFNLYSYPLVFAELLQLEYFQVDNFEITEQIIIKFKKGIDLAKTKHKYVPAFGYKIPMWSDRDTSEIRIKYEVISQYTIEANDYALSKENIEVSSLIIEYIKTNSHKELQELVSSPNHLGVPIFESLKYQDVFNNLLKATNETISAFNWGLYGRYTEGDPYTHKSFIHEKDFFCELQKLIGEYIDKIKLRKISTVHLIDLNKNLMRIKELKV